MNRLVCILGTALVLACSGSKEPAQTGGTTGADTGAWFGADGLGTGGSGAASTSSGGSPGSGASASSGGGSGSIFPAGVTAPRLMIIGDSISAGPGCYKKYLLEELTTAGYSSFEFVGAYTDDCGGGVMHSAVSCTTSANFTQASFTVPNCFADKTFQGMAPLMAAHDPDLVMIQLGVNDVWGGAANIDGILANYATLVEQARAHNPNVVLVVAQIHRIITDNCVNTASTTNAEALVSAVPAWAAAQSTAASPVFVADLWTNSDAEEADDCVHPDDAGARRMGENWFNALKDILPKD